MVPLLYWILTAAGLSFAISAIFAGRLQWRRNNFLLVYIPIAGIFIYLFYRVNGIDIVTQFTANWQKGMIGAGIVAIIALVNVLKQKPYPRNKKGRFILDLLWPGFSYGMIDGMLLSVLPVTAVISLLLEQGWTTTLIGTITMGALALAGSFLVTVVYHIGYPEFRSKAVLWTLVGNGLMSLAFIITGSPIAAVLPHIIMHITVVVHGRETTLQLPPHYVSSPSTE